jgi:hypothetical protein
VVKQPPARIVAGLFILIAGIPDVRWVSDMPPGMFTPPLGVMSFFASLPDHTFTTALLWCTYLVAALFVSGLWPRVTSVALTVLLALCFGLESSFGKINHTTPYLLLPITMAWGVHSARTLSAFALVLGWMYFTAAVPKILGGWLDPSTHASYGYTVETLRVHGTEGLLTAWAVAHVPGWAWEVLDVSTILWEATFLWAAFSTRRMILWMCAATFFHTGVWLVLNIPATGYVACYAALYLAFTSQRTVSWSTLLTSGVIAYAIGRAVLSPVGVLTSIGIPFSTTMENGIIILGGAVLGAIVLIDQVVSRPSFTTNTGTSMR